jgi:hypothetical protein
VNHQSLFRKTAERNGLVAEHFKVIDPVERHPWIAQDRVLPIFVAAAENHDAVVP